jgi:hypothetical protein
MLEDVIFIFCINLWGFYIDFLSLVYNSAEQETLFCVYLSLRDLIELKWSKDFSRISQRNNMRRISIGGAHEARTSTGGARPTLGCTTMSRSLLEHPLPSVLISN